jgi:hypothetical protein
MVFSQGDLAGYIVDLAGYIVYAAAVFLSAKNDVPFSNAHFSASYLNLKFSYIGTCKYCYYSYICYYALTMFLIASLASYTLTIKQIYLAPARRLLKGNF